MDHSKKFLIQNLSRLARFGANLTDAFSCFIFLPASILSSNKDHQEQSTGDLLQLCGAHSLCDQIVPNCKIPISSGLIGWVAKNSQSIHVSPFERDSTTLGTYLEDQSLKSLIGIPINLPTSSTTKAISGVITCDSKKAYAFSKLQGKLLSELAAEITCLVKLILEPSEQSAFSDRWNEFYKLGEYTTSQLGESAIDIIRTSIKNFNELELELGVEKAARFLETFHRSVRHSIPSNFPMIILPTGDVIGIVDNMMSSFIENKLMAIVSHLNTTPNAIDINFAAKSFKGRSWRSLSLTEFINSTSATEPSMENTLHYEYRRA